VLECSSEANSCGVNHASRADQLRTSVCGSLPSVLLCWSLLLLLVLWSALPLLPPLLLLLPWLKRGVGKGRGEASTPPCKGTAVTRSSHW
jgi:hypothetical protein